MGRIADSLRDAGATTLDVDIRTGEYTDRSQYRNVVTAVGTPTWSASARGWGLLFLANNRLEVPASSALNGPKSAAFLLSEQIRPPLEQSRLLCKRDATAADIEIFTTSAPSVSLYNNIDVRSAIAGRHRAFCVSFDGLIVTNSTVATFASTPASGANVPLAIGNFYSGGQPANTDILRVMLFNVALSQTQAQDLLQELLTERVPTKVYSTQAYVPSGTTRQVVDDYDFTFGPVTFANITTANAEIPGIIGLRLMSGSVSVKAQPKAIGCTSSALLACYDTRSRSKRFSFVWTDSTIDVGWASVRGVPTATGQNAYWVQVSSGGVLRIAKSVSASESVVATGPTLTAGIEYDAHVSWDSSTGAIKLWYRRTGASDWTLACEATDASVNSCSFNVISLGSSNNKITRRFSSMLGFSGPESTAAVPTSGMVLWLKADDPTTVVSGGVGTAVTQWLDSSGSGNHATSTLAPRRVSDNGIGFSASKMTTSCVPAVGSGPRSMVSVGKYYNCPATGLWHIMHYGTAATRRAYGQVVWDNCFGNHYWSAFYRGTATQRKAVFCTVYDGAVDRLWVNGVLVGQNTVTLDTSSVGIRIGCNIVDGEPITAVMHELIAYNRALSPKEVGELSESLMAKWGI